MNFETLLDKRLYQAIETSYVSRNYTGAILDAIYFLSNLIRDKTGLESDGPSLIGQAFGGNNPRLKVSRLQTESELNVQKGVEQILRGIYQAIRNPRSHEKHTDDKADTDSMAWLRRWVCRAKRSPLSSTDGRVSALRWLFVFRLPLVHLPKVGLTNRCSMIFGRPNSIAVNCALRSSLPKPS